MTVEEPGFKIILIDNGSQGSARTEMVKMFSNDHKIIFIQNDVNLGFAGGSNVGIRLALQHGAEFILLLNNDVTVKKDFLRELLNAMSPDVGIVGSKVLYYDHPDRIWSDGGVFNWLLFKGSSNKGKRNRDASMELREVDTVAGCSLFIKREAIQKVGLLDERYFLYGEEDDWCFRVKRAGYRVLVAPKSVVLHKVSRATGSEYNETIAYYKTRNKILFIRKNLSIWVWPTAFAWLGLTLCYRFLQALRQGKPGIVKAIFQALKWHMGHRILREAGAR
jgi:GT2 family glycosyltransferase